MIDVQFKILDPRAIVPSQGSTYAAGWDLHAVLDFHIDLAPMQYRLFKCGFAVAFPAGYEMQVRPRSGLALKHGITVLNSPGTIDADYRGEVGVILYNAGNQVFTVEPNMRIAQAVFAQHAAVRFKAVEHLNETERGSSGYGSTGT